MEHPANPAPARRSWPRWSSFDKVLLEAAPLQAPWHRCQECVR